MEKENEIYVITSLADELNLCFHWKNEFNILFPEEDLQYELYNEIAPNFFSRLIELYYNYFIIKISNLLDPPKISGFDNLSLYQLVNVVKEISILESKNIKRDIDNIKLETNNILRVRKKIIAHNDLNTKINKINLGETKFTDIESTFDKMSRVINKAFELLGEPQYSFIWLRDLHGATGLVQSLKQSSYYKNLRTDRKFFYEKIEPLQKESKYYSLFPMQDFL